VISSNTGSVACKIPLRVEINEPIWAYNPIILDNQGQAYAL